MKLKATLALTTLLIAPHCFAADDLDNLQALSQAQFKSLSKDLGAALSYKPVSSAEPLGLTGFDIGVEVTATEIENEAIWNLASSGDAPSTLIVPKLHAIKGLPFDIDVGAMYSSVPDTNISLFGLEARYAILPGDVTSPALAVRGTYSKLSGVDQLDLDTKGLELTISKGFAMFTPYAGVGRVWVDSQPNVSGLNDESFEQNKVYLGGNFNLMLINLAAEYDRTDGVNSYTVKIGARF